MSDELITRQYVTVRPPEPPLELSWYWLHRHDSLAHRHICRQLIISLKINRDRYYCRAFA